MGVALTLRGVDVLADVLGALHDTVHAGEAPALRVGSVTLHPHQREAASLLLPVLRRFGGALLADPVGTGKTWSALGVATHYRRLLVVAPAALRSMWTDALARAHMTAPVLTFEALSRGTRTTDAFDLVIVDEAHHARNPATHRFKALAEAAWGAHILLLSATPLHNSPADLRALCSLFLGSGAESLEPEMLSRVICRRALHDLNVPLPRMSALKWLSVPDDGEVLREILGIPPPLPPADGGTAAALGTYVLVRQWCSSDAALIAALNRRLLTGAAMTHRLSQGHLPSRRELLGWLADAGAVQLTLSLDDGEPLTTIEAAAAQLDTHVQAVRTLRDLVRTNPARDAHRLAVLQETLVQHAGDRVVLFTHSVDTARSWFEQLSPQLRVACLDGQGGRIVSGRVPRDDIIRAFRPATRLPGARSRSRDDAMRIDVLIATDVLSEGVDLHDANVVVHLDLPWTVARLDQRVGRLRRLGSPHDHVQRYAFQPPAAGSDALHLLDRLAAKAGLSDSLVGLAAGSFDYPGRAEAFRVTSPADARDALRELTRDWPRQDGLRTRRAVPCAAARNSMGESGILAAVSLYDEPLLVGVLNEEVVVDPSRLLQLARGVTKTTLPPPDHLARRSREALEAWFEAEQARGALLLEAIQRSNAHRGVLRLLHGFLRQGGRYMRHEVLPVVTELRALVLGSQGIHAEIMMNSWMTAHPRPTPQDMRALVETLRPGVRVRSECRTPGRIVAMLLLVPD